MRAGQTPIGKKLLDDIYYLAERSSVEGQIAENRLTEFYTADCRMLESLMNGVLFG